MDSDLLHPLNELAATHHWIGDVARFLAEDVIFILLGLLAVVALLPGRTIGRRYALSAVLASGLGLGLGQLLARVWDRPRPFVGETATEPLIAHSPDSSFPSDHAIVAAAIATSLLLWNRRLGGAALALVGLICLARVSVGVHYPSDVLVGALVGAAAALALQLPPLRGPVSTASDRIGALYDGLLGRVRPSAPSGQPERR